MDLLASPGMTVLKVLQDIDLAISLWSILEPAIPEAVVSEPVLSGAGFKGFIPAFGPGQFVLDLVHLTGNLFTQASGG